MGMGMGLKHIKEIIIAFLLNLRRNQWKGVRSYG